MDLLAVYRKLKKHWGRSKILTGILIELKEGLPATSLVFVRDKHKKDWLALLFTDMTLADEEIARIYGKR